MSTPESKVDDTEYQEAGIVAVRREENDDLKGYVVGLDNKISIFVPDNGIEPKPGMTIRMYGKGLGFPIRGVNIDGKEVFYKTAVDFDAEMQQKVMEKKEKAKQEYESKRAEFEARVKKLPPSFQMRIHDFRCFKGPRFPDSRSQY